MKVREITAVCGCRIGFQQDYRGDFERAEIVSTCGQHGYRPLYERTTDLDRRLRLLAPNIMASSDRQERILEIELATMEAKVREIEAVLRGER